MAGEASTTSGACREDRRLRPDVVILDILLPDAESGLGVLEELAATGRAVIALSVGEGFREAAFAAGAVAFVGKYAGSDVLLQTLRDVVVHVRQRA